MANLRTNNLCGHGGRNAINGSVFFDGVRSFLQLDGSSEFAFGTTDFTIEMWIKIDDDTNTNTFYDSRPSGSNGAQIALFYSGSSNAVLFAQGGSVRITGTTDVGKDHAWHHIVLARQSGSTKLFVNGIQEGSTYSDSTSYENPANRPFIGGSSGSTHLAAGTYMKGYISNVRVCIGHAVYFSNFTPPSSPLKPHFTSVTDKSALLCCQNSDNPIQDNSVAVPGESIPKTITAVGSPDFSHNPDNLIKNGRFTYSADAEWTLTGGTAALGTGQSGVFNDGNHLVLTASSSYAYLVQAFTTKIGRTYRVNCQSNGADNSFISTTTSESDAIITDIRSTVQTTDGRVAEKNFNAEQTTYYMILRGGTGGGNFDTASAYEEKNPIPPKVLPPFGTDNGVTFDGAISMNSSSYMCFPTGRTEERGRGRAIFGGGQSTTYTSAIHVFNIQSQGNTVEVGQLSQSNWGLGACGSSTRGLFGGGRTAPGGSGTYLNTIEFVTIANAGNSSDFGDLTRANSYINSLGNETRGIWGGGYNVDTKPATNVGTNTIDYVTIASTGNAADFGDLVRQSGSSDTTFSKFSTASSTRGLFAGGYGAPSGEIDEITYITIATTGNTTYFGDLTATNAFGGSGASSSTRGIVTVGGTPGPHNRIEFVTIASTGNATDFGDLSLARRYAQGVSNKTRAVFITGYTGADTNLIDFVNIATTGNATDFGDRDREDNYGNGATSDSHGGLS